MKKYLFLSLILLFSLVGKAQNVPSPMNPPRLVNDFAGIFGDGISELEDSLDIFSNTTSNQIAVVTINDLEGYAPSDYALAILRQWGVGNHKKNNGVVILIKPRNEFGRGEVFISVGTGLEGILNDGKVGRIIDDYMIEYLKNEDYLQAASIGSYVIRSIIRGEYTIDENEDITQVDTPLSAISFLISIIICIIILRIIYKGGNNNRGNSGRNGGLPPILFFGPFKGGSSGTFGRGIGGGFGGFGGGSGIGGGAGRSF